MTERACRRRTTASIRLRLVRADPVRHRLHLQLHRPPDRLHPRGKHQGRPQARRRADRLPLRHGLRGLLCLVRDSARAAGGQLVPRPADGDRPRALVVHDRSVRLRAELRRCSPAARIGVGIGEASASPAAYSMIADYFPEGTPRDRLVDLFERSLHRRRHSPSGRRVRARRMGTPVPECRNCPARPCAMAGRLPCGGTSGPAPRSLDLEPEGAAARSHRRPPVRHRPSQRLARFRARACRHPSSTDTAERRPNSRSDGAQSARSRRRALRASSCSAP